MASLRSRIILSLVIIVTVTSGLFAFGVLLLKQQLEEVIFGQMVKDQLQVILLEVREARFHDNHLFEDWSLYRESGPLPAPDIAALPDGSHHHIIVDGHYYQIEVATNNDGERFFLAYDITDWENLEHTLLGWLAAGIGLLALVTLAMGFAASRSILAPVTAFTRRLQLIRPDQRRVQVADEFRDSEISLIANAFDEYLARMDRFVERERSFTAAASHELRNPLSVMLGALDVIEADNPTDKSLRATARLRRATGDMQAFIEAALLMAREESLTISNEASRSMRQLIEALVEDATGNLEQKGLALETVFNSDFQLDQPASLIRITLGNLLRNAIEHSQTGPIRITLDDHLFTIEDRGQGIRREDLPRIFERSFSTRHNGTGMGLDLVRRICERFYWQIEVASTPGTGTTVTIRFPSQ